MVRVMRKEFISFIIAVFTITACKKEIDILSFAQCHDSQHLDSITISNRLTGSWKWSKQSCFWSDKTVKANKTVQVTFNSNTSFTISENSNVISQGTWKLKIVDSNSWGLDLSLASEYLYGRIFLCNNQVLFNNSYIDGCDNLFNRSQ